MSHPQRFPLLWSSYWGELLREQRFGMLLEATWLVAPEGAFPDQPPQPRSAASSSQPAANGTAGRPAKPFQAAAGYVPPHVRGASGHLHLIASALTMLHLKTITGMKQFPGFLSSFTQLQKTRLR